VSSITLDDYGYYLAYPKGNSNEPGFLAFREWIRAEAGVWKGMDGAA